jgi:asparagine synthase (glutamine-hydrolysing)
MCGLCGEFRFDGRPADLRAVSAMAETMQPRGPDSAGAWAQDGTAFGHRRLSIIDLSDESRQPMVDSELGLAIAYNGAIYNYKELRVELEAKGYRFFSHGDTEVLLKACHAWGEDFVTRLHGMFAFAIWNRETGALLLARDRLGIKPLYLAETGGALRFASSLPALLAAGGVDTSIDPVALNMYMSFHSVVPAPHTILNGVRKLPPATVMRIDADGRRRQREYWTLSFERDAADAERGFGEWQEMVLEALRTAVKRRLVADVPVGVLLSGGLDSSLIVGLLAEQGADLRTFSIGFESVGEEKGDEFQYSDIVVDRFGTDHTKLFIDTEHVLPALDRCVNAMSEPMVSHDNVGFFLLSREVAKHVKVVQSGQGADEVFAGYHWYPPLTNSNDPVADYARVFRDRDAAGYAKAVQSPFHGDDHSLGFIAEHFARPGANDAVDKALRLDSRVMLVDDPVKRVDNMTMAASLEARVPFLDHELVELAARIPAEHKLAHGGKGVLKEAARAVIPDEVIDRPKGYFPVPALKYIRGPYFDLTKELLTSERARERGLFTAGFVDEVLADPDGHITPLRGSTLWQMALLEYWLQTHGL